MMEALIAGERSPRSLADLAQGKLTAKRDALLEAMTGQFEDHHARLLKLLLATVDHLSEQIAALDQEIAASIDALPDPRSAPADTSAGTDDTLFGRELLIRLDEIPGVGPVAARALLAEIGPDMTVFPSPDHLASWARLCPRTIQSGAKSTTGPAGKGNPWLKGALGEAASAAARTDTFLGARYRRLVKRRGHAKALVAVARSILVIAWHLISDPQARYHELGPDWHHKHLNPQRRTHDLVQQLERLGHTVTLAPTTA